jgi:hypothetical protein
LFDGRLWRVLVLARIEQVRLRRRGVEHRQRPRRIDHTILFDALPAQLTGIAPGLHHGAVDTLPCAELGIEGVAKDRRHIVEDRRRPPHGQRHTARHEALAEAVNRLQLRRLSGLAPAHEHALYAAPGEGVVYDLIACTSIGVAFLVLERKVGLAVVYHPVPREVNDVGPVLANAVLELVEGPEVAAKVLHVLPRLGERL